MVAMTRYTKLVYLEFPTRVYKSTFEVIQTTPSLQYKEISLTNVPRLNNWHFNKNIIFSVNYCWVQWVLERWCKCKTRLTSKCTAPQFRGSKQYVTHVTRKVVQLSICVTGDRCFFEKFTTLEMAQDVSFRQSGHIPTTSRTIMWAKCFIFNSYKI